jgi:acyl carrier protein
LVEEFELEDVQVTPEALLYEHLGLDSLDSVDLVVALEKEFGFKIDRSADAEKLKEIRTVQHVCEFVGSKRGRAQQA